jgi:hypothetical protein
MINRWVFRIALFIVGCLLVWWLASCNTIKGKRLETYAGDSTAVKTLDSTASKASSTVSGSKTEIKEEKKDSYEKTTNTTPVPVHDPVTNKTYIYPSTVIHEKGQSETTTQTTRTDSLLIAILDKISKNENSLVQQSETSEVKEKDKTTKLNATPFIMAGVVILAMFGMLIWFMNKKFDKLAGMIPNKKPA